MSRFTALAAVLALFVVGGLVGALSAHLYHVHYEGAPTPGMRHSMLGNHLAHELGLDPEQERRVEEILEESHREAEEIRRRLEPLVREHVERVHERIAEVLRPDQRERLDALVEQHGPFMDRLALGPPGHRPPPRHPRSPRPQAPPPP